MGTFVLGVARCSFACIHMWGRVCVWDACACALWGQSMVSGVFLDRSPPHSLRQGLWENSQLTNSASPVSHLAPGTLCVFLSNARVCSSVCRSSRRAATPLAFMWVMGG